MTSALHKTIAVSVTAVVAAALAQAEPPPPPKWAEDSITVAPTIAQDLVRELRLGQFTARFEKTSLEEIGEELGSSSFGHSGDASESIRWLCYSLPGQLVWLIGTEMSGSRLMDVVVAEAVSKSDSRRERCAAIPAHHRPVSLEFGWIGSTEAELHSKLGKASGFRDNWQLFSFVGKASLPYRAPDSADPSIVEYDVMAYVEAKIEGGKVTSIRAVHHTTY